MTETPDHADNHSDNHSDNHWADHAQPPRPSESTDESATGHPDVDAVLDSLRGLEEAPVSDHVGVFERAHDRLRSALADAGEGPA